MGELSQPTHLLVMLLIFVPFLAIFVPPFWMICKKAGFSPWLSLLVVVPWVNLAGLYFLAFSNWRTTSDMQEPRSSAPVYPPPVPPRHG